jgi:hypothetical protein
MLRCGAEDSKDVDDDVGGARCAVVMSNVDGKGYEVRNVMKWELGSVMTLVCFGTQLIHSRVPHVTRLPLRTL